MSNLSIFLAGFIIGSAVTFFLSISIETKMKILEEKLLHIVDLLNQWKKKL